MGKRGLANGVGNGRQLQALPLSELPPSAPQLNHKLHVLRTWMRTQVLLSNGVPTSLPPYALLLYPHSFTHTHSTPRQLHVILSFDVFGGLMSIPCAGSRGTSHRQIVVPPPCCCNFLLLYFLLLYSFLLLLLCLCWKTNITIIILTTISGICASVERNERQNETQPETRRDVGQAVEKR